MANQPESTPQGDADSAAKPRKSRRPRRRRKKKSPVESGPSEVILEQPTESGAEPAPAEGKLTDGGFTKLGLSDVMLQALAQADYLEPTPIQAGLIPRALAGVDVMGQARTGTGKTAAFAIPVLERIAPHRQGAAPQALVLVPTRELAVQVRDEFAKLAAGRRINVVAVYGGKPIRRQTEQLQRGAEVVVGTPGRVMDHMARGTLRLNELSFVVLDEADRMLDIGFRPDIEKILRRCPESRQSLLLSATIPPPVKRLAERYMRSPEMLDFSPSDVSVDTIEQFYFTVDPERKFDLLLCLIRREDMRQAIIFCRTRKGTEKLANRLSKKLDSVASIHGDLMQRVRDRVMGNFREGKLRYLVATDVVGRGIDVTRISHIINFDIPQFCDDYVHRVGRAGRMGREGVAYTFVAPEEGNELTRIEMRINRLLKRDEIPEFEAFAAPAPPAASGLSAPSSESTSEPPKAPPAVFGRRVRRVRRAL